ncbi:Rossmann-like and DUF2520 domain-containing protein [Psychroflexus sp. MES1-P1E]|uniref:Rossmann-like and DUF2520 domain-containing protein n=1 Tax=Psychroflexus sp. MES1-P1E TaxID=2058320 RepID=UPI000C79CAA9|nr:Rossmann-like and DUF2520 domain-containing protein [Psychroflexus sp. MES1-P1E]PKG41157.1 DUF2520 domain-containing protein [Psychroflexus sp. MES1-P1E]
MYSIVILGSGNVATHMFQAFQSSKTCAVIQVYNHNKSSLLKFENSVSITTDISALEPADLYLICLKDDVIESIAKQIKAKTGIIAHTSGNQSLLTSPKNSGVFYPLQTFSKTSELDYSTIPFCLEANSEENLSLLKSIALSISQHQYEISTAQRQTLHLAAVFVCNFTNHLYAIGEDICLQENIPFDILKALIKETSDKVQSQSPSEMQTGPAVRNDEKTITNHLKQLNSKDYKAIYNLMTNSILQKHDKL